MNTKQKVMSLYLVVLPRLTRMGLQTVIAEKFYQFDYNGDVVPNKVDRGEMCIRDRSYLELVQISENTGAIVKPIIQIQKDMAEVKNNTSKL